MNVARWSGPGLHHDGLAVLADYSQRESYVMLAVYRQLMAVARWLYTVTDDDDMTSVVSSLCRYVCVSRFT